MGAFITIANPHAAQLVDPVINLTNPFVACCSNPVGMDDLLVARGCAEAPASGGRIFVR